MKTIVLPVAIALVAAATLTACSQTAHTGGDATMGDVGALSPTMTALPTGRGGSAHVKSAWAVNGANISIEYGRPSLRGRPEAQMMPPGRPWRTGADAATVLTTDRALTFGTHTVQPGSYTINTVPGADQWQIVFGTLKARLASGASRTSPTSSSRGFRCASRTSSPVELVTFHIDRTPNGQALRLEWGTVSASVPFTIER